MRRSAAAPSSKNNDGGNVLLDGSGDLSRGQQRRRPLAAENGKSIGGSATKRGKVSLSPIQPRVSAEDINVEECRLVVKGCGLEEVNGTYHGKSNEDSAKPGRNFTTT